METYKEAARQLKRRLDSLDPRGYFMGMAMPFARDYSGNSKSFLRGDFDNLQSCVTYVNQTIPESEWRRGMNVIAGEEKEDWSVRPNPLHVAMSEANDIVRKYTAWLSMPQNLPFAIYSILSELDYYHLQKIEGLAHFVFVMNSEPFRISTSPRLVLKCAR